MTNDRPALFARIVAAAPAAPCAAAVGLMVYLCPILLVLVALAAPVAVGYALPLRRLRANSPQPQSAHPISSWTDDELEQFAQSSRETDSELDDFADEYLGRIKHHEPQEVEVLDLSEVDLSEVDLTGTPKRSLVTRRIR